MVTITTDEADEIVWGNPIAKQHVCDNRWDTTYLIVYKRDEALLGFHYREPATEMQEGQECYETDPVQTFPVRGIEKTVTVYEPVP